ncbi:fungal-specific transcription factor domain-containing protein [Thelonectria olida]|uniref:Fungal-specific transcription factor domain-containing protein n=1 Tax=Thelonectria olida TaxID=1576542 RepID=A0A9P9AST6_9HYPO|nr:fungal-specific transcription factor domain-containing protein [Thelonectria olida]
MDNYPKRKQRTACDICRRRKVRCDVAFQPSGTCSSCRRSGTECLSTTKWATARRSVTDAARTHRSEDDLPSGPSQPRPQLAEATNEAEEALVEPISPPEARHEPSASSEQEKLARIGLALFLKHGVTDDTWAVFDSLDRLRIAYVGTAASNISHLVDLHRSSRPSALLPSTTAGEDEHLLESLLNPDAPCKEEDATKPLHYPYPPIRQSKAWTPNVDVFGITSGKNLLSDVSSVPEPEIRDALVSAYFEHIHPFLPFLSKDDFINADSGKRPPLLLYQAVMMAGAHACSHPIVAENRHWLKSVLFRRASMLFHIRHETDRTHLMQAAILFTWYTGDGDTVTGGPYYWSGIASRIGCGLGAHRRGTRLLAQDNLSFKLSWWSAFVCDVFSSLDTGRPNSIRPEEIDQLRITLADTDTANSPETSQSQYEIAHLKFLKAMVDLAYIGIDIIVANAPSQDRQSSVQDIDAQLGLWSVQSGVFSDTDNDPWTCQLGIHYNLLLLYLHRNNSEELGSKSVCSVAAQTIVSLFEQLRARDGLKQCHFTAANAIIAAGIQIVNEIRSTIVSGTHSVAIDALARLARLLRSAKSLGEYWLNMESVHTVFKDLHEEYEGYVTQFLQGKGVVVPENSPDWCDLFTGIEAHSKQPNNVEDWMSIIDWNNF